MKLIDAERIEDLMIIKFGDKSRTHEIRILLNEFHANWKQWSSLIENKFCNLKHILNMPKAIYFR